MSHITRPIKKKKTVIKRKRNNIEQKHDLTDDDNVQVYLPRQQEPVSNSFSDTDESDTQFRNPLLSSIARHGLVDKRRKKKKTQSDEECEEEEEENEEETELKNNNETIIITDPEQKKEKPKVYKYVSISEGPGTYELCECDDELEKEIKELAREKNHDLCLDFCFFCEYGDHSPEAQNNYFVQTLKKLTLDLFGSLSREKYTEVIQEYYNSCVRDKAENRFLQRQWRRTTIWEHVTKHTLKPEFVTIEVQKNIKTLMDKLVTGGIVSQNVENPEDIQINTRNTDLYMKLHKFFISCNKS